MLENILQDLENVIKWIMALYSATMKQYKGPVYVREYPTGFKKCH